MSLVGILKYIFFRVIVRMGLLKFIFKVALPIVIAVLLGKYFFGGHPVKPEPKNGWWGLQERGPEPNSAAIEPFRIEVSKDVLVDLRDRILRTRFTDSLPGTNFEYGPNSAYMRQVAEYWVNQYNWRDQESILNSYPQYVTNIEGIQVHFVHVKPSRIANKARPLLLIHGWPGSFWELYKLIPLLSGTESTAPDIPFELIIPSLPGYGFSEAPHQPGFDISDAARMFDILMRRLGHQRYYVHGGDWGALITKTMGQIYDSNVIGVHMNFAGSVPPMGTFAIARWQLLGSVFPWLVYTPEERKRVTPLKDQLISHLRESGYLHIQATRPDTLGAGLNDSPIGLATYILEKFSLWGKFENRFCPDGCLSKHYSLDDVLTNIMIYWVTNSITTSVRFYRDNFGNPDNIPKLYNIAQLPLKVPTGVASFPHEVMEQPESLVRVHMENVIQFSVFPTGGHFPAMEEPKLLADDIIKFVKTVEELKSAEL